GDSSDAAILTAALKDSAWQVREGGARGWAGLGPHAASEALESALTDTHPDVRKAAVLTLSHWPDHAAVRTALQVVLADTDSDVRAYARRTLEAA
ncbi:oxidoreductase, partial [Nocardia nova]